MKLKSKARNYYPFLIASIVSNQAGMTGEFPFMHILFGCSSHILNSEFNVDIHPCLKFLVIIDSNLVKCFILADDSRKISLKWVDVADLSGSFSYLVCTKNVFTSNIYCPYYC